MLNLDSNYLQVKKPSIWAIDFSKTCHPYTWASITASKNKTNSNNFQPLFNNADHNNAQGLEIWQIIEVDTSQQLQLLQQLEYI